MTAAQSQWRAHPYVSDFHHVCVIPRSCGPHPSSLVPGTLFNDDHQRNPRTFSWLPSNVKYVPSHRILHPSISALHFVIMPLLRSVYWYKQGCTIRPKASSLQSAPAASSRFAHSRHTLGDEPSRETVRCCVRFLIPSNQFLSFGFSVPTYHLQGVVPRSVFPPVHSIPSFSLSDLLPISRVFCACH